MCVCLTIYNLGTTSKGIFEVKLSTAVHPPVATCNVSTTSKWCCSIELDNNLTILSGCVSSSTFSTALQVPPKTKFEVIVFSVNCGCEESQIPYFSVHTSSTSGTSKLLWVWFATMNLERGRSRTCTLICCT